MAKTGRTRITPVVKGMRAFYFHGNEHLGGVRKPGKNPADAGSAPFSGKSVRRRLRR